MRKAKKGSMELGINSIVILIIALAILGLGIGFVTNLFNKAGSNMENIIGRDHLPIHADVGDPIKLNAEDFTIKNGKSFSNPVSVYNDGKFGENPVTLSLSCPDPADTTGQTLLEADAIAFKTGSQVIPIGSDSGYKLVITIKNANKILTRDENTATMVCTVSAIDNSVPPITVSKQVVLTVTS